MESKVNYTAVGTFVLALGLALAASLWWLSVGGRASDTTPYLIYATDNVNGLRDASDVQYRGVKVGQVASIEIDPANPALVRIMVNIDRNVPVRADAVAQLSPQGVTGLSLINLSGGNSPQPLVAEPGQPYPVIRYAPSVFSRLEGGLNDAAVTLSKIATRLDSLLSAQNVRAITRTLQHVERVTAAVDERRGDLSQALVELHTAAGELAAMGAHGERLSERSEHLLQQLDQTAQDMSATLSQVNQAAQDWQQAGRATTRLSAAGTRSVEQLQRSTVPNVDRLSVQLQRLGAQLTELSSSLQRDPSQLVWGAPRPAPGPGEH